MPGIDWELRVKAEGSELAALNRLLKETGVNVDDVKKKAAETRQYESLVRELKKAGVEIEGVTKKEDKLAAAENREAGAAAGAKKEHESFFGDMVKAQFWVDSIEEGIKALGELAEEFVKSAAEAVDFDYKTDVALKHMTGSAAQAKDIMGSARSFANGVGEDLDKVYGVFQKLASTGLRGDNLTAAANAANDLAKVQGIDFSQTIELFRQVGSEKGFGQRGASILAQYPGLLKQIKNDMGLSNASFETFSNKLKDLHGADAIHMLEQEVMKFAHENQLGDVGVEFGESFGGGIQRIKNDWKEAMGSMADDPAMEGIRDDIAAIADYFDPANEGGKELTETMKGLGDPVKELFDFMKENKSVIADALSDGIGAAKVVLEGVKLLIEGIVEDIKAVQMAGAYLGALWETKSFKKAGEVVQEEAQERSDKEAHQEAAENYRKMSPAERKEQEDFGTRQAAELPALRPLPAAASGGTVTETGMVTVHEGEEIVPAGISQSSSSNSSVSNGGHEFHFHISGLGGGGGDNLDEQKLATKLAELAPGAIMSALEQMNQMRGGR
jgi:hypothetical protein